MSFDLVKRNLEKVTEVELKDFSHMFLQAYEGLKSLQVTGVEAFKECTRLYKAAKDWKKQIEAYRKKRVEPLRTELATINDRIKDFVKPLDDIENLTKVKLDGYSKLLEEQHRIEQESVKRTCEILDIEAPHTQIQETSLRGDGAIVYEKTSTRFEVVNLAEVPLRYLQLNEDAVKLDLKLGLTEIPGIRVWEEKTTQVRSR